MSNLINNILGRFDTHMQELLRGASVAFVLKILSAGLAFVLNVVLARFLGADGSGIYFLAFTVVLITATIGRIGMENALVRFIAANVEDNKLGRVLGVYNKAIGYAFTAALLLAMLLYFFAPWLSHTIFDKPALESPLKIMSLAVVPQALLILHAYALQGLKRTASYITVMSLWVPLITVLLSISFITTYGIDAASYGYLVATMITLGIGYHLWRKAIEPFSRTNATFETKRLLGSSIPLLWMVLMNLVITWSPLLFLGVWESSESVGIYNAASRTAMLTSFVLVAVNSIAAPKFAALYQQGDIAGLGRVARNSAIMMVLLASPVLLLFMGAPKWILGLFGEQFTQGAVVLMILAAGQFVNAATGSVGYLLMMTGNEQLMRDNLIFCAFSGIILSLILIPQYGVIGAAMSAATILSVQNVIAMVMVWRKLGIMTLPWLGR